MMRSHMNFSWVVKDLLACFSRPTEQLHIDHLKVNKINDVISLTEQLPDVSDYDIEFYHIPIIDYTPPSIDQIKLAVTLIQKNVNKAKEKRKRGVNQAPRACSKPTGLHCAKGNGRTGTIAAAYLAYSENLNGEDAINMVRSMRPKSIETKEQENIVKEYACYVMNENKNKD